jgi:hypothetical protein
VGAQPPEPAADGADGHAGEELAAEGPGPVGADAPTVEEG